MEIEQQNTTFLLSNQDQSLNAINIEWLFECSQYLATYFTVSEEYKGKQNRIHLFFIRLDTPCSTWTEQVHKKILMKP